MEFVKDEVVEETRVRAQAALAGASKFWFAVSNDVERLRRRNPGTTIVELYETSVHLESMELCVALQEAFATHSELFRPERPNKETLPHVGPFIVCVVYESA